MFANARGMKSQLSFVTLMMDNNSKSNIVKYGSNRCRRVMRSVMASKILAFVLGFDFAHKVCDMLSEIINKHCSAVDECFDVCMMHPSKHSSTVEQCLTSSEKMA